MVLLQLTTTKYLRKLAGLKMGIYCFIIPKHNVIGWRDYIN